MYLATATVTRPSKLHSSKGIVLPLTLIIIAIMLVMSVTALRSISNNATAAGNSRDYELAYQAAEAGLKACELKLSQKTAANNQTYTAYDMVVLPADPMSNGKYYWERDISFWTNTSYVNLYTGPSAAPVLLGINATIQPKCIIEPYSIPPDNTQEMVDPVPSFKTTSRGDGARLSNANEGTSKVFLQSIIKL